MRFLGIGAAMPVRVEESSLRIRTFATLVATVAVALVVTAAPALASYGGDGGITINPTNPKVSGTITIDSSGWKPNSKVTITLHSDPVVLGTATADGTGAVHATETIPAGTAVGAHTVELTGTDPSDAPRTVTSAITVTDGGSSLPRTGAAIAALVIVALVLFVAGSALSAARKRVVN